ncbi:RIO1-domain-containing protein [Rhizophagus irregularis]|uniref:non-specific serine/threonine protein kinase n=1 Tax=Rhizophagus irregularis TaxID=588596 RepID=A0A2N1MLE4_9GLOM|nr:RIO1-domain-containing protein [Rhizophagus irregularis]
MEKITNIDLKKFISNISATQERYDLKFSPIFSSSFAKQDQKNKEVPKCVAMKLPLEIFIKIVEYATQETALALSLTYYDDDGDFDDYFEDELKNGITQQEYNRLRQKLQAGGTSSGSIKYQKGPSKGSSLSASRDVSDEARKKVIETKLQEQMKILSKYANRIHLDEIPDGKLSVSVTNDIKMSNKKALGGKQKNSDKSDRATVEQVAIKVYKTSILVFKDRDRYVTGEYRFRHEIMARCPEPLVLRLHVLVMSFLRDKNGWAYPILKDAVINSDKYPELYYQLIKNMGTMYHKCRLVHADLISCVIHVKDISNVTEYFKRKGVSVMSIRELFDFIIDINIGLDDEQVEAELDKIKERLSISYLIGG